MRFGDALTVDAGVDPVAIMTAPSPPVMESAPSPQLRAANRRLLQRRRQFQATHAPAGTEDTREKGSVSPSPAAELPEHLGWHSEDVTAALRRRQRQREQTAHREAARRLDWLPPRPPAVAAAVEETLTPDVSDGINGNRLIIADLWVEMVA